MTHSLLLRGTMIAAFALLSACGGNSTPSEDHAEHGGAAKEEFERGPHRGRMLRDGEFAVEMTIFEDGVEPEFHAYLYRNDAPVAPSEAKLTVELRRLGGKVDRFAFAPKDDYLRGNGVVHEPHSFDVKVSAVEGGRTHSWSYASYEGRTTIAAQAAKAGGVTLEKAGSVSIAELVQMAGRVEITPEGKAEIRARLPGVIVALHGELGQPVSKGQVLARVESQHSLQTYSIMSPISGIIIQKNANVGGVTGEAPLLVVADPRQLHAEFFVYPRDAERVRVGQKVAVRSLSGQTRLNAEVEAIVPTADLASQTLLAHVHLPASAAENLRAGMGVEGDFEIARKPVGLAVRTRAIQRFRDFEVVFARVKDTYEVRMLEIGQRTPEWTEVLGGLEPGTEYVVDGAFLIRADIEKSGASHDH